MKKNKNNLKYVFIFGICICLIGSVLAFADTTESPIFGHTFDEFVPNQQGLVVFYGGQWTTSSLPICDTLASYGGYHRVQNLVFNSGSFSCSNIKTIPSPPSLYTI